MGAKINTGSGNPITSEELAWIGSCLALGAACFTPFVGGILADRIGRKKTLLGNSVLFMVSFVLLGVDPSYIKILVARVVQVGGHLIQLYHQ